MVDKTSPPVEHAPSTPVGPGVRTTITLLVMFHLFALAIGVVSLAAPLSPLRNQLREVPFIRPYLRLLHMDTAYNFHLTDGLDEDLDHFVVVQDQQAAFLGESGEAGVDLRLPQQGMQPLLRRERFQQLAQVTAAGGEGDPIRPLLAKAIGQGLLRRAVAPDGTYTLRVQRQTLVDRENIDSPERSLSDPYAPGRNSTAYEGAIILSGDEAYFSEIAPAQQRAGLREEGTANGDQP